MYVYFFISVSGHYYFLLKLTENKGNSHLVYIAVAYLYFIYRQIMDKFR